MPALERIGITIPSDLLRRYDRILDKKGYENRSEAIRDLVRDYLVAEESQTQSGEVIGSITLVYDHSVTSIAEKLTEMQHDRHEIIVSGMHVHLTRELCMEVIVLQGPASRVNETADRLLSLKGVHHGKLVLTSKSIGGQKTHRHSHK